MSEVSANLEPKTLELFLYIAGEAEHWDMTPPIEGLRRFSREDKGRFMQLKKHDLLFVDAVDVDNHVIHFTNGGIALAAQHGLEIE
ncbi:hypothetical protein SAMN05216338_1001853 [Bradyrhizobium sp. Rc2d]|uniref:hypothetical protein n=1 Tax=Bradyrhizobium sp. Rc2d TaxID=1855321 RepID=UPI000883DF51|nr:hypothetical protein [Bradyrhizobium sp. Rc2d]SDG59662.1 hypothetical protein SAMN05216338_1001853 [Bradyrhizobium sp. Rc2d]